MRRARCRYGTKFSGRLLPQFLNGLQADCVFPTRTARFGVALTFNGPLNLSMLGCSLSNGRKISCGKELSRHSNDLRPIDEACPCPTCRDGTSRAFLHHNVTIETATAHGEFPVEYLVHLPDRPTNLFVVSPYTA